MLPKILPIDSKGANPTTVVLQMFFTISPTDESQTQLQDVIGQVVTFWNLRTTAWPAFVALLAQMREYYEKNGRFPDLRVDEPSTIEKKNRTLRIMKGVNLRTVPSSVGNAPVFFLDKKLPLEVEAEDREDNGYVPIVLYAYGPNTQWK